MDVTQPAHEIAGKMIRFKWTDGPTRGKVHEHIFHVDGNVEWRDAALPREEQPSATKQKVPYAAKRITDSVYVISYRSLTGHTLTCVLNFQNNKLTAFASNSATWVPVQGTFEVI